MNGNVLFIFCDEDIKSDDYFHRLVRKVTHYSLIYAWFLLDENELACIVRSIEPEIVRLFFVFVVQRNVSCKVFKKIEKIIQRRSKIFCENYSKIHSQKPSAMKGSKLLNSSAESD